MLINTVVLMLEDALPVALLIGILLGTFSISQQRQWTLMLLVAISTLLLVISRNTISDYLDGMGYEIVVVTGLVLAYLCLLIIIVRKAHPPFFALAILLSVIISIHVADFLLYLVTFGAHAERTSAIVAGSIIGGGIGASISILFYIGLSPYRQHWWLPLLLIIFVSSHVADSVIVLQQIGVLEQYSPVWNTGAWITDDSEYGQLLNALVGYQAQPQKIYLITWLLLNITAIVTLFLRAAKNKPATHAGEQL